MPMASMCPVSPSSGMVLTVKIHKDRNGHVIMKDPTPFLSPLSSVGSSSPTSSPSNNLKQGHSQQAVYICERSPMINKIKFETHDELSTCTHREYDEEELENKASIILDCLSGIIAVKNKSLQEVKLVDLWHLRQLALTPGGLINSSIRKRGWLKLVDANDHIFTTSAGLPWDRKRSLVGDDGSSSVVSLSDEEIALIQADIEQCKWDIENLIKLSRKIRKQQRRTGKNVVSVVDGGDTDSISNASFGSGFTSNGRITPQMIPESIRAFPRLGGHTSDGFHLSNPLTEQEHIQSSDKGTFSIAEEETPLSQDPPQSIGKRILSKEERSLLLNIILSVLREIPDDVKADENEESRRLYYFQGMYNIAAVLLITLESPSLSSLAMKKLAQFHFRDYCAPTFMNTQAAIRIIFMPLLKEIDPFTHQTFLDQGIDDVCSVVLPWIICWYANDILEYDLICRLFDVFMSSHALLPIYMAVAFVTHPWSKLEFGRIIDEGDEFMSILASIPSNMVSSQSQTSASFCIEQVIERSLTAIRNYPPDKIVTLAERYQDEQVSSSVQIHKSIIPFQEPPQWTYKASTNTDWTLIQEARKLRESSPNSRETKKREIHSRTKELTALTKDRFDYQLALDASGLLKSTRLLVVPSSRLYKDDGKSRLVPYMMMLCAFSLMMGMFIVWETHGTSIKTTFKERHMEQHTFVQPRNEHTTVNVNILVENHDDVTDEIDTESNSRENRTESKHSHNSTPHVVQPILHSTKFQTLLWTLPLTCDDSWCTVPTDQIFGDFDWITKKKRNVPFHMKSNAMEAFVSFAQDLIQNDPDCFFVMV